MVFELQTSDVLITEDRFSVWSVYSVTNTSPHLNPQCINDIHMIAIAVEAWSIMQLSMFLKNQLYSLP